VLQFVHHEWTCFVPLKLFLYQASKVCWFHNICHMFHLGPALPLCSELVHHDCSRQSVFSPGGRRGRRNRARRWVVGSMSGLLRRRCLRTLLGARLGRRDCPQTRERSPLGAVTMVPPGGWSLVDNKRNTHIFMQTFHTLGIHFIPK
jgi:hypothetical protein